MKKPELLSPAGNFACLVAAVNAGCDAVYLGGKQFSARQSAENFTLEEIEQGIQYCRLRGVKVYTTINTLLRDHELKKLVPYVKSLYEMGIDGVILQDMGAARLLQRCFPGLPLHASTQMTAHSLGDVQFLKEQGFQRVVLARELSLEEIRQITEQTDCEVECFIHGALCVSYSGQCLMSSMMGGRSGNRGACAQPCRLPYQLYQNGEQGQKGCLLSPKDLQTLNVLGELMETGITSLKIEGRMKSPEYVAGVTSIYRKYIDAYQKSRKTKIDETDEKALLQLFNRDGFTDGYFKQYGGKQMMSFEQPKNTGLLSGEVIRYKTKSGECIIRTFEDFASGDGIEIWTKEEPHVGTGISKPARKGENLLVYIEGHIAAGDKVYKTYDKVLMDRCKKIAKEDHRKIGISGKAVLIAGCPMYLKVWDHEGHAAEAEGPIVEKARQKAMSEKEARKQLMKTGNTTFELKQLDIEMGEDIFIQNKELNELRRQCLISFANAIVQDGRRETLGEAVPPTFAPLDAYTEQKLTVSIQNRAQFEVVIQEPIARIYVEANDEGKQHIDAYLEAGRKAGIEIFLAIPRVMREDADFYQWALEQPVDGYLLRNYNAYLQVRLTGKKMVTDYNLHVMNSSAIDFWKERGVCGYTLSPELAKRELVQLAGAGSEVLVYGHLPLMVTHQCPVKDGGEEKYCRLKNKEINAVLTGNKGEVYQIQRDCSQCLTYIYNGRPIFLSDFRHMPGEFLRLSFTAEGKEQTKKIMAFYVDSFTNQQDIQFSETLFQNGVTRGRY